MESRVRWMLVRGVSVLIFLILVLGMSSYAFTWSKINPAWIGEQWYNKRIFPLLGFNGNVFDFLFLMYEIELHHWFTEAFIVVSIILLGCLAKWRFGKVIEERTGWGVMETNWWWFLLTLFVLWLAFFIQGLAHLNYVSYVDLSWFNPHPIYKEYWFSMGYKRYLLGGSENMWVRGRIDVLTHYLAGLMITSILANFDLPLSKRWKWAILLVISMGIGIVWEWMENLDPITYMNDPLDMIGDLFTDCLGAITSIWLHEKIVLQFDATIARIRRVTAYVTRL